MSKNGQWYPPEWPDRIRAHSRGELTPVTPRLAATVMLLRDTDPSDTDPSDTGSVVNQARAPYVYLLRRRTTMAFAAGAYAYPGGSVDARDEAEVRWAGPTRAQWAERLGVGPTQAQSIVCAAVRETFEEAGVLLAGTDPGSVVEDVTGADWEADRRALVARDLSFADFLARRQLVLRSDLLGAWARWITPEFEARRYDTWFFVAVLPAGQRTRNASTEADRTVWTRPADAAAGYDRAEMLMMPPTISTLRELSASGQSTATGVLGTAAQRDLTPILAQARLEGDEIVLSWPGHQEFEKRISTV